MPARIARLAGAGLVAVSVSLPIAAVVATGARETVAGDGIVRVKSAYSMEESIDRIKKDIAQKGIMFFSEIDQGKLAADAGVTLNRSVLLVFGNPPLGTQFITANANSGLDWPVRLLVTRDEQGNVWAVYTDFGWIARRHRIDNLEAQFAMAAKVIASITSSVTAP